MIFLNLSLTQLNKIIFNNIIKQTQIFFKIKNLILLNNSLRKINKYNNNNNYNN
jgi:hypothetical protein